MSGTAAPNLSHLSDAELMRLYNASAPAAPAIDVTKMSDADLMAAYRQSAPSASGTSNVFDQFDTAPDGRRPEPNPFDQFDAPAPAQAPGGANAIASGVSGGVVEGIPILGPALRSGADRAAAYARTFTHGGDYASNLAEIEGRGKAFKEAHPYVDTGAQAAGGILGTLPAVAAAPAAFGAGAGGLAVRSAVSGLTSAGIGGADAAVRTTADPYETARGALYGAAGGLAGPTAGLLIGRGVGAVSNAIAGRAAPVPGLGNRAANMLAEDFRNAGGVPAVQQRLAELGPEAMLLDASPSFTGRAQGLAVRPETREAVVSPLMQRQAGANARLTGDLDAAAGPAADPALFGAAMDAAYARDVPGLYRQALGRPVTVDTAPVLGTIRQIAEQEKGGAANALNRAWGLLHTEADVPGVGRAMVPDRRPEALHNAKEALDAMIATVRNQQGSAAGSELRALSAVRSGVNEALEAQVPGYAEANRTAQAYFQRREAFDRGQTLLNGGRDSVRPAQLAASTAGMEPTIASAQRLGARAELDRLVGTTANDRVALSRAVQGEGDWNRARLETVFGPEPTQRIVGAVEREGAFDRAYQDIVRGSQTAQRTASAAEMAPREIKPGGDGMFSLAGLLAGYQGAAGAAAVKAGKAGVNAAGRASDIARNRQLAELLAQAATPARSEALEAMARRIAAQDGAQVSRQRTEALVRALMSSQSERVRAALPSR